MSVLNRISSKHTLQPDRSTEAMPLCGVKGNWAGACNGEARRQLALGLSAWRSSKQPCLSELVN